MNLCLTTHLAKLSSNQEAKFASISAGRTASSTTAHLKCHHRCVVDISSLVSAEIFLSFFSLSQVFKALTSLTANKGPKDVIFDKLSVKHNPMPLLHFVLVLISILTSIRQPAKLNQYLDSIHTGLTTKMFRTFKASTTLQTVLDQTPGTLL